ncbi:Activated Cdc42 kinase-like [Polypedilum vanderplanki]|uniref:Activated Cdc42 kinase-like n=1 Tax=Polypedilum vanderplanki TaxID=319348 RepID=A0A9J6C9V5_POLVA|nr:Activated Cdc42 kinase-like [Polypedilum vanderplanki]
MSTITAENTLAYKSLVEDPKELLLLKPIEPTASATSDEKGLTLPRPINLPLDHVVPQSNKAATLSKLLRITKDFDASTSSSSSSSPLKALRDKSCFPIVKPRLRILPSVGSESVNSTTFLLDHDGDVPCETPSYMANANGNFTLNVAEITTPLKSPTPRAEVKPIERSENNSNPLPLPPRDPRSTLQLNVAQKRHVRKHPLIIPAIATQRTLDKFNQITPVEDKSEIFGVVTAETSNFQASSAMTNFDDDDDDDVFEDLKKETKISQEFEQNVNHYGMIKNQEKNYTKDFIENNFPPTYQNLDDFQIRFSIQDQSDTASLHFESILEDENSTKIVSDDMVDGFGLFDNETNNGCNNNTIAKPTSSSLMTVTQSSNISGNNSNNNNSSFPFKRSDKKATTTITATATSTSIEAKKNEFSQKFPKYKMPRNELASNALFNKIKESVEMAATADECEIELETENGLNRSNHHVSCEELLDFSEQKQPPHGPDSDEVRIIRKMFGSKVTLERCLLTLDFINWNLEKAIKLLKLQNQFTSKSLQDCFEILDPHWDLNSALSSSPMPLT